MTNAHSIPSSVNAKHIPNESTHSPPHIRTYLALVQSTQSGHLLLEVVDAALFGQLELVLHQGREEIKHAPNLESNMKSHVHINHYSSHRSNTH